MTNLNNRYDIVYLFDVKDGNPNGDPDASNMPRMDSETEHGLVSDVCLKRKVRDYLAAQGEKIFYTNGVILNDLIEDAHKASAKDKKKKEEAIVAAREHILKTYYDIRAFGAVLDTGPKAGQVRGPLQVNFSRSIDPISWQEHQITRKSVTTKEDAKKQIDKSGSITGTMGTKFTVSYGLYRTLWTATPIFARETGFTKADFMKFLKALKNMWDIDRSSSRGFMAARGIFVFEHTCPEGSEYALGRDSMAACVDRVKVTKKVENPRSFEDYEVSLDDSKLPEGLKIYKLHEGEMIG